MDLWKAIFLYNPLVFRFHVNLPACTRRGVDEFQVSIKCRTLLDRTILDAFSTQRRLDGTSNSSMFAFVALHYVMVAPEWMGRT